MRPPRVALTLHDMYDPRRGLWFVTGPQPERDVYATIELSRIYVDVSGPPRVRYRWYLNRRSAGRLERIADGAAASRDQALRQITEAWTRLVGAA